MRTRKASLGAFSPVEAYLNCNRCIYNIANIVIYYKFVAQALFLFHTDGGFGLN